MPEPTSDQSNGERALAERPHPDKERKPEVEVHVLELLVCPISKTSLEYDGERQELVSRVARLAFPIRDGVPMMTVDAARHLDDPVEGTPKTTR